MRKSRQRIDVGGEHSGITITYTKRTRMVRIDGHYDGCVGIAGESVSLRELLTALGITREDCTHAFFHADRAQGASNG